MASSIQSITQGIADFADPSSSVGAGTGAGEGADFSSTLQTAVEQVGKLQSDAQNKVAGLLGGDGEDIHSAMLAVEKANVSFEMMVQVRNKIVQAYQTISQMPF
ncbi:MAG TPA: flagellar hook-basal body complex protein FliE [Candidatus Acidoferrales bacterium]|jgi:flagellar hook-basal body complex protein FliE|nr:flagellar hook-basal body complex protein FliE [Candidatus Acidoferrales bacterium]